MLPLGCGTAGTFVAWVCWAPFSGSDTMLVMHALLVPFLWLHWLINDDTCALTLLESWLRGVDARSSFFHRLVSPVFKLHAEHTDYAAWGGTALVWCVSLARLAAV